MYKSQARGYLLEIVLEKLIKVNGYDVVSQSNGDDIIYRHNSLNVRGRGGYHQVDSLGEFKITPPFMYPLRLFVEAKFYTSQKVSIERVRMGIGVLQDVNTNYSTVKASHNELNLTKYDYHYALFSTSGFSEDSQRLALAHKISLIDLSNNKLACIKRLIEYIVDLLASGGASIPSNKFNDFRDYFRKVIHNEDISNEDRYREFTNTMQDFLEEMRNKSIYIASIRSSQIVALIPDDNEKFKESLLQNPHQEVSITWEQVNDDWIILPKDAEYRLSFRLPELFIRELKDNLEQLEIQAMNMKETRLATMSFIAYLDDQNPTLCTLKFSAQITRDLINQIKRQRF